PYNLYQMGLNLTQPLFVYGSFSAVRQARLEREIGARGVEMAERDLTKKVIAAFYKVVLNQNSIRILTDQEKVVAEALSTAQTRVRLGGGRKLDLLQVRTEQALLKPKVANARIALTSAAPKAHPGLGGRK